MKKPEKLKTMELSGETVNIKTVDLNGLNLSWAVFAASGILNKEIQLNKTSKPQPCIVFDRNVDRFFSMIHGNYIDPMTDVHQLVAVIEARDISFSKQDIDGCQVYLARVNDVANGASLECFGDTRNIAIYRCYVANQYGADVNVPVEVAEAQAKIEQQLKPKKGPRL